MKVRRPWFKFWPDAWLSARSVALMTPAQKGVYIDLLCLCWQEGAISSNPDELAFLLRLPREEFKCIWDAVQMHFRPVKGSPKLLTNDRLEQERANAADRSAKNTKASEIRWKKDHAFALQTQSKRYPSEAESRKQKQRESKSEHSPDVIALWEEFNQARMASIPGAHALAPTDGSTKLLRDRLKAGETADSVRHVIAVYAAEAKRTGEAKYFTATTPFRPENFARALSQPLPKSNGGGLSAAQQLALEAKQRREAEFEGER